MNLFPVWSWCVTLVLLVRFTFWVAVYITVHGLMHLFAAFSCWDCALAFVNFYVFIIYFMVLFFVVYCLCVLLMLIVALHVLRFYCLLIILLFCCKCLYLMVHGVTCGFCLLFWDCCGLFVP